MMSDIRRQLDQLKVAGRSSPDRQPRRPGSPAPRTLQEVLGGAEIRVGNHACWLVETPSDATSAAEWLAGRSSVRRLRYQDTGGQILVVEPRRAVVLDIETGGLAGMPVFLIGLLPLDCPTLTVRQLLARDYPEEQAILSALAEILRDRDTWITFNGKSFDEPALRDRATVHGVPLPGPTIHIDLLHGARRRWRRSLPDHRLTTLEQYVLGRRRVGDVPGCDVPDLFHHFYRTGNPVPLRPVLEHNRRDLLACVELLARIVSRPEPAGG